MSLPPPDDARTARLRRIVDDLLLNRDSHGLPPGTVRDLQLAAAAINHDRFHRLLADLARVLAAAARPIQ